MVLPVLCSYMQPLSCFPNGFHRSQGTPEERTEMAQHKPCTFWVSRDCLRIQCTDGAAHCPFCVPQLGEHVGSLPCRHLSRDSSQMLDVLLLFEHLFPGPALPQMLSGQSAYCCPQSGSQRTDLPCSDALCSHHSLWVMDLCFAASQGNEDKIAPLFCLMLWPVSV